MKRSFSFLVAITVVGYSIEPYLTSGRYSVERNQWEWNPDWRPIDVDYGNDTTTVPPSTPAPGTPIGYSNWYPGRSGSNNKDGHCLGLVFNYGFTYVGGYWYDFLCDSSNSVRKFRLICESFA